MVDGWTDTDGHQPARSRRERRVTLQGRSVAEPLDAGEHTLTLSGPTMPALRYHGGCPDGFWWRNGGTFRRLADDPPGSGSE